MARALLLTAVAFGAAVMARSAGAQPSPYAPADRYGPAAAAASTPYGDIAGVSPPRTALRGRVLAWPGKVEHPVMTVAAPMQPPSVAAPAPSAWRPYPAGPARLRPTAASQTYRAAPSQPNAWTPPARIAAYAPAPQRPQVASASAPMTQLAGAPTRGWRPVFATQAPASAPASAPPPSSVAASPAIRPTYPAAFATPPNRAFAADRRYGYDPTQDHAVRFYSVARPFGLKPDPAPIPPQFFTASADLSGGDPPGPLPVNHTTAATRAAVVGGSDSSVQ